MLPCRSLALALASSSSPARCLYICATSKRYAHDASWSLDPCAESTMWRQEQQQGGFSGGLRPPWRPAYGNPQPQQQPGFIADSSSFPALSSNHQSPGRGRAGRGWGGTGGRGGYGVQDRGGWHPRNRENYRQQQRFVRQPLLDDNCRHWLNANGCSVPTGERFSFLSYNILSADNAREHYRELYYHIPMRFVKWDWRRIRLLQEIEHWSPDVMCLQEVDRFDDLQKELRKNGYAGTFKSRTGHATDGCAIFWKENRFLLVQEESTEFRDLGLRDNVAQFCVLKSCTATITPTDVAFNADPRTNCLIVGNTHLLFNPKRGDIKMGQARTLLETAKELSEAWGGAQIVLAGDFNSTPSSPMYRFISGSELDLTSVKKGDISGQLSEGEGGRGGWQQRRGSFSSRSSTFRSQTWSTSSESSNFRSQFRSTSSESSNVRSHTWSTSSESINLEATASQHRDVHRSLTMIEIVGSECDSDDFSTVLVENGPTAEMRSEEELGAAAIDGDVAEPEAEVISEVVTSVSEQQLSIQGEGVEMVQSARTVSFVHGDVTGAVEDEETAEEDEEELRRRRQRSRIMFNGWSAEEVENATGSPERTVVSHELKLRSAYSEIEGQAGSRDQHGEPMVTTYHKKFMGTVDYIWHTEGLKPIKVLDTLPVNVLRRTGGLPSQKWGSDHLALVCELAFVEQL